jgi:ferredoxin
MGIHEWSYDNDVSLEARHKVPWADKKITLADIKVEVELGFDKKQGWLEAQRCLNCDVQTVFTDTLCIECDACVDICPMDCITFTVNGDEGDLRKRLNAPAPDHSQDLYVSGPLKTQRVMVKDENVCLHCGLCAERCPTGAWDMAKSLIEMTYAGPGCRTGFHPPLQGGGRGNSEGDALRRGNDASLRASGSASVGMGFSTTAAKTHPPPNLPLEGGGAKGAAHG